MIVVTNISILSFFIHLFTYNDMNVPKHNVYQIVTIVLFNLKVGLKAYRYAQVWREGHLEIYKVAHVNNIRG